AGELGRGDDLVEALLEVVRDERMERMGPDRQPDAGHRGDLGRPARRGGQDDPGPDRPGGRLDADDALAVTEEPGHRAVLDDMDAASRGAGGIGPRGPV